MVECAREQVFSSTDEFTHALPGPVSCAVKNQPLHEEGVLSRGIARHSLDQCTDLQHSASLLLDYCPQEGHRSHLPHCLKSHQTLLQNLHARNFSRAQQSTAMLLKLVTKNPDAAILQV